MSIMFQSALFEKVKNNPEIFRVPIAMQLGGLSNQWKNFWIRMGNIESQLLADKIQETPMTAPIYVSGLARSGSTILLEILSAIQNVVTHQYRDFPAIFIPYIWNAFLASVPAKPQTPVERTHLDGMHVTPNSPEAMEEILWMAFFETLHRPENNNVLRYDTDHPAFEKFYTDHIKKLLLARQGDRYVSKGNYNITRFEYLLKLFPDARFVIPIRRPDAHVASLMKQHSLFCEGETLNPRMLGHMSRVGHFEFGLDRRPINIGSKAIIDEILAMWEIGMDAKAWARYWASIYGFIGELLDTNASVRQASVIVRFEDLCHSPETIIQNFMDHCDLAGDEQFIKAFAQTIHFPAYYQPDLSPNDLSDIECETDPVARRFGY